MREWLGKYWLETVFALVCASLALLLLAGGRGMEASLAAVKSWKWPLVWGAHVVLLAVLLALRR